MKTLAISMLAVVMLTGVGCAPDQGDGDGATSSVVQGLCQPDDDQCVPNKCTPASCCPQSPIVFDMLGDGFSLTDASHGVTFALSPGEKRPWSWTAPGSDDAWLALDLNGNGKIDDGGELFGNETLQPGTRRDGFHALAQYDANHDGKIDKLDTGVWSKLVLWNDANHDGVSQPSELRSLDLAGVLSIGLTATISEFTDQSGNEFRLKGTVALAPGSKVNPTISDVWLQPGALPTTQTCTTVWKCSTWTYALPSIASNNTGCSIPSVFNEPRYQINGVTYTLVAKTVQDQNQQLAYSTATSLMNAAMDNSDGFCLFGPVFQPDPVISSSDTVTHVLITRPGAHQSSYDYRFSCTSHLECGGCSFDGGGAAPQ